MHAEHDTRLPELDGKAVGVVSLLDVHIEATDLPDSVPRKVRARRPLPVGVAVGVRRPLRPPRTALRPARLTALGARPRRGGGGGRRVPPQLHAGLAPPPARPNPEDNAHVEGERDSQRNLQLHQRDFLISGTSAAS